MFDDDDSILLYGAAKAIQSAEDAAHAWKGAALKLRGEVESRNDTIRRLMAQVQQLEGALKTNQTDLDNRAMHIAGLEAQRQAYMEQHADSPLLQDSGKRFKVAPDQVKTKARLIYEAAHDRKGRELGISNPAERRND